MTYYYTTNVENAGKRLDYWQELISKSCVPLDIQPHTRESVSQFDGGIELGHLAGKQIATVTAGSHQARRNPRMVALGDEDIYCMCLQVSGTCRVDYGDRQDVIHPGSLMLLNSSDTYQLDFAADHKMVCVHVPRAELSVPEHVVSSLTGTALSMKEGVGALMQPFLLQLSRQVHETDVAAPDHLARSVVDLADALLIERLGKERREPEKPRRVLLMHVRQDIEENLSSPDLSAEQLAAKHHITTRQLHAMFETVGVSVEQWIQERRLEHCRRDLRDPDMDAVPAADIGARWGMPNAPGFEQIFTARFKTTPHDYRLQQRVDALTPR